MLFRPRSPPPPPHLPLLLCCSLLSFACGSLMYDFHVKPDARRSAMIRRKEPGPYEDRVGPTVLAVMLMISIVAQFVIKVVSML